MENIKSIESRGLASTGFRFVNRLNLKNSGYTQIISTISHELRTPVSILKSNIQLLKGFSFNIEPDLKAESLFMCEESVENMIRFLDNIQLLNTAIKSELIPKYSPFKAKKIVYRQYLEMANLNLEYSRISIRWDLKKPVIISDLALLRRILTNLLSNAFKFSKDKVFLFISTSQKQISIVVQDSGIGIPEEELELIFKPFYRATNAIRTPGVGLGLAIVSTLAQSVGGRVYISSKIEEGTTVKIVLPYES